MSLHLLSKHRVLTFCFFLHYPCILVRQQQITSSQALHHSQRPLLHNFRTQSVTNLALRSFSLASPFPFRNFHTTTSTSFLLSGSSKIITSSNTTKAKYDYNLLFNIHIIQILEIILTNLPYFILSHLQPPISFLYSTAITTFLLFTLPTSF